jgi:hypothetical protein
LSSFTFKSDNHLNGLPLRVTVTMLLVAMSAAQSISTLALLLPR